MTTSSPLTAAILLERLRTQPAHTEQLATLLLDDLFSRSVRSLLDPQWVASSLAADLKTMIEQPGYLTWLEARFVQASSRVPRSKEPLRASFPADAIDVVKGVLARPSTPGRELVHAIVDQPGVKNLLQNILKNTLTDFNHKLSASLPGSSGRSSSGLGLRSKLMGVAKGVASAVGSELERQVEDRVNAFLRDAMERVVDMIVDRICDPSKAKEAASFRVSLLNTMLDLPREHFRREIDKQDPKEAAADAYALLCAFAKWDALEPQILELIETFAGPELDSSLHEILKDSGLEEIWRARLQDEIQRHCNTLFANDSFSQWLETLCSTE